MGLATHAAAIALGYLLGSPEGRARLAALGGKGRELAARPEVKQARERAWDLAGEAGLAAKNTLTARTRRENAGAAGAGSGGAAAGGGTSGSPTAGSETSGSGTAGSAASGEPAGTAADAFASATADSPAADPATATDPPGGGAGTADAPERLPATTVAEDTQAVVTGLPVPDADRPEPRATQD